MYASSGGKTPTASDSDWAGNGVVRLRGWDVPLDGDTVRNALVLFTDSLYQTVLGFLFFVGGFSLSATYSVPRFRFKEAF